MRVQLSHGDIAEIRGEVEGRRETGERTWEMVVTWASKKSHRRVGDIVINSERGIREWYE
jgi:hypothetical protein